MKCLLLQELMALESLICFYDQNGISIDGEISDWFTDNTVQRFESYNWQVIEVDGHNIEAMLEAIAAAKEESSKTNINMLQNYHRFWFSQ